MCIDSVCITLSFGDLGSLHETSLGLLKVDDVPNRAEVLRERMDQFAMGYVNKGTYIDLDIFILAREKTSVNNGTRSKYEVAHLKIKGLK